MTFELRRHLETTGHVTATGTSRRLTAHTCRTCHSPTLRGLDADTCAFEITLDPTPLDPLGEVLALTAGRRTYDLTHTAGRYEINPRTHHHITRPRRYPVLTEHRCGQPLPVAAEPAPAMTATEGATDEPPF